MGLVLIEDLFVSDDWETHKIEAVEVGFGEGNGRKLVIAVSVMVENSLFKVVTRGVDSVFVFVVAESAATVLLLDRVENVEELVGAG